MVSNVIKRFFVGVTTDKNSVNNEGCVYFHSNKFHAQIEYIKIARHWEEREREWVTEVCVWKRERVWVRWSTKIAWGQQVPWTRGYVATYSIFFTKNSKVKKIWATLNWCHDRCRNDKRLVNFFEKYFKNNFVRNLSLFFVQITILAWWCKYLVQMMIFVKKVLNQNLEY